MKKVLLWVPVALLAAALGFGLWQLYGYLYPEAPPAPPEGSQAVPTTQDTTPKTEPAPTAPVLTAQDFTEEAGFLTCTAVPCRTGIDVSTFQGQIDWQKVREAGVAFAIIRVGGRGYGQSGTLYADKRAQENYQGAKEAGLDVGAYFFSQATSEQEAVEEAEFVLEQTKDWVLTEPLVMDWECMGEGSRTANVEAKTLADCMNAFSKRIRQAGKTPMIYLRLDQPAAQESMALLENTPLWLAKYDGWTEAISAAAVWQYSNTGRVPGIAGNVDLNLQFLQNKKSLP